MPDKTLQQPSTGLTHVNRIDPIFATTWYLHVWSKSHGDYEHKVDNMPGAAAAAYKQAVSTAHTPGVERVDIYFELIDGKFYRRFYCGFVSAQD